MALQCGIIGLTNSGKTTLFNCISDNKAESTAFAFSTNKSNIGTIKVPDNRLAELNSHQETQKIIPTTVEIVDVPGLTKGSNKGEGVGNKFLSDIKNTDALIHVLRCFDDENLPHIDGSVNPIRDMETIDLELQIKDLESVEKKIVRLEKIVKSGDKDAKKGIEVLKIYKDHLENFQPARTAPVEKLDAKHIDDLFLFSAKPVFYVCNVDEGSAVSGNNYVEEVKEALKEHNAEILTIAAGLESEIAELESLEDRQEFLEDVGLSEPSVNSLIRSAYKILNLETFFTVGPKEIRAWTLKKGMTAPQAAGVIHSDLERGFIRAEVMKYNDFVTLGSENACKEKGKLSIEGKNYIVEDGDILHIRFNV
ncbi:MAG: redox-regulated ATPase YchF [Bacteroidetes bacterium]|jgi:ribosome-binding ATPase|nr:redox-regulated ATPase YchF [Bacteroidota bacterium]MBT6686299.1 redox-regulated ATPase YchF [Bacteroidota bacterium]MBT7145101.1 redox-regulated ATPase YchF [Bacteroidota bacterium]MBT7490181.1 redox-regulated ATPase YchF [Bacteroidota bacterium]